MDIPGYHYDPQTRRYFRITNENRESFKRRNPYNISSILAPKPNGILGLLQNRSYGSLKNPAIENPFLKLKTKCKFKFDEQIDEGITQLTDVSIIKGGKKSILGVWNRTDELYETRREVCHEVYMDSSNNFPRFKNCFFPNVADFCDCLEESQFLVILCNNMRVGTALIISRQTDPLSQYILTLKHSSLFSCCSRPRARQVAIGSEDFVLVVELDNPHVQIRKVIKGNILALHYNDTGTVLYSGINSGNLCSRDLRQRIPSFDRKLFQVGVNEIAGTSKQHELICSSIEGQLVKIDLRKLAVVCNYEDHKSSIKKNPISFNYNLNIMAATGVDNITRIWNVNNGGKPIQMIRPPVQHKLHKAWLLNDPWNSTLFLFQDKFKYSYKM